MPDVAPVDLAVSPPGGDGAASPDRCLQCRTELTGPYCHSCGQHSSVAARVTFRSLWTDFRVRRLNFDHGLLRTVIDVLVRPGLVARTFVEGRRQTYTHPITLLFVVYAIYAIVFGFVDEPIEGILKEAMRTGLPTDAAATPEVEVILDGVMRAFEAFFRYGAYFAVLIILPFAATLRWLLSDRGRTLAECAVFGAYIEAAIVVPSALFLTPIAALTQTLWVSNLSLALYLIYAGWGARQFFDRRLETVGLSVLSMIIGLIVYFAAVMVVVFFVGVALGIMSAHTAAP